MIKNLCKIDLASISYHLMHLFLEISQNKVIMTILTLYVQDKLLFYLSISCILWLTNCTCLFTIPIYLYVQNVWITDWLVNTGWFLVKKFHNYALKSVSFLQILAVATTDKITFLVAANEDVRLKCKHWVSSCLIFRSKTIMKTEKWNRWVGFTEIDLNVH